MMKKDLSALAELLLPWFYENQREMPWRRDREPYHIWLSEIMLQQTRVEAVRGYYIRFLEQLPTVQALSCAEDELLYKLWEGLGYYSRVRNLKKAARKIVEEYNGAFPQKYEDVLKLPGIGEYTAGAICSIAFDQPTPAVDGNVLRVFSRLTDDDTPIDIPAVKKQVRESLIKLYPANAGDFTQALMELGATICGPDKKPQCEKCPCKDICLGYQRKTAEDLPVRLPKKSRRQEKMTVFVIKCKAHYALQKRPATGLLAGLWQFPNVQGHLEAQEAVAQLEQQGIGVKDIFRQVEKKHIFTHIQWDMRGIYLEAAAMTEGFTWLTAEQIEKQAALPTAFRQFWEELRPSYNRAIID